MAKAIVKKKSKIALQKEAERKAGKKALVKKIPPPALENPEVTIEPTVTATTDISSEQAPIVENIPPPAVEEITAVEEPQAVIIENPVVILQEPPAPAIPQPAPVIVEEDKAWKDGKRNPMTGMFTPDEREYIDIHLQARIAKGLSKDANHFVRQCVNFAVNFQPGVGWTFGRADIPREFFE